MTAHEALSPYTVSDVTTAPHLEPDALRDHMDRTSDSLVEPLRDMLIARALHPSQPWGRMSDDDLHYHSGFNEDARRVERWREQQSA